MRNNPFPAAKTGDAQTLFFRCSALFPAAVIFADLCCFHAVIAENKIGCCSDAENSDSAHASSLFHRTADCATFASNAGASGGQAYDGRFPDNRNRMSEALIRATVEALRRGDGHGARAQFEALMTASPPGSRLPWLTMAQACRLTGDVAAETRALEAALRDEPRNLAGLLLMGDRKQRDGDDRAATAFYQSALANAGASPPPSLQPLLQAAQRYLAQAGTRFEAHLTAALVDEAGGLAGGARMQAALDLLLGRTQLYLQQPSMFYFPGLPQRQFYERDEFPWLAAIEAAAPAIRAEFEAVLAGGDTGFQPYVEAVPDRPAPRHSLLDDPNWSAFFLWKDGRLVEENARRCPATMAAFADVPAPHIAGWSPMLLFSVLRPGTHIEPHCGVLNTRLICHLPIVVPDGCGLRVGNEVRQWREGETLIFDDSIEHEAWNRGESARAVLLFEIWRPEIDEAERAALTKVLEAIRDYRGSQV